MTPTTADLRLYRGNDQSVMFRLTDTEGQAYDLGTSEMRFRVWSNDREAHVVGLPTEVVEDYTSAVWTVSKKLSDILAGLSNLTYALDKVTTTGNVRTFLSGTIVVSKSPLPGPDSLSYRLIVSDSDPIVQVIVGDPSGDAAQTNSDRIASEAAAASAAASAVAANIAKIDAQALAEGILNPASSTFGAKRDGSASAVQAFNDMFEFMREVATAQGGWQTTPLRVQIPPGDYLLDGPVNGTSLRSYGTSIQAYGAVFIGAVPDAIMFDLLDTRFLQWKGGNFIGGKASIPRAAIVHGRRLDNRVADTISFEDVTIAGHFKVAGYVNLQAETTVCKNMKTSNFRYDAANPRAASAALLCGNGNHGLESTFVDITDSAVSFNCMRFDTCDFKTFDSDTPETPGVPVYGGGYAVRMITDYTDGAALRDVRFIDHYSNAREKPDAVQDTDHDVSIFYLDGYAHNLVIKGRSERRGYIDAVLRIENSEKTARVRGLDVDEHYLGGTAGLVQATTGNFPVFIENGHLSATVSQEAQRVTPLDAPHGTLFGPPANRDADGQLYFTGVAEVPADSLQNYRLNNFTGCKLFTGTIRTHAGNIYVERPLSGSYELITNSQIRLQGPKVFDELSIFIGSPQYENRVLIADDGVGTWDIVANSWAMLTAGGE